MASRSSRLVVVEAGDEAEAVAQRPGDEPGAGGGADQREARQVEADRPGGRALAQHDVELEVLHRRVQHLFDRPRQPVDLVDEEDVALVEVGEDGGEVAGPLDGRARRDVDAHAHLGGDDAGQRRLAQAGRPGEQQVVGGLAPPPGGLEDDREVLLQLGLADELGQAAGPQADLVGDLVLGGRGSGVEQLLAHRPPRPAPGDGRGAGGPRLSSGAGVAVVGQVHQTPRGSPRGRSRARPAPRARRPGRGSARRGVGAPVAPAHARARAPRGGTSARSAAGPRSSCRRRARGTGADVVVRAAPAAATPGRAPTGSPGPGPGPTPWAPSSASKHTRSSRVAKPYSVCGVLAHVVVVWTNTSSPTSPSGDRGGRRDRDPVADPADLDEHLAGACGRAACPAATRSSAAPPARRSRSRGRVGEVAERQGHGVGGVDRPQRAGRCPSSVCTMRSTSSLVAAP